MPRITLQNENWHTTLPVIVEPDENEWFGGFLLRCDQANGWNAGETVSHILQSTSTKYFNPLAPSLQQLWDVGRVVGLSLDQMEKTTYHQEMKRLEGDISRLLLQPYSSFTLKICPECVYQLHFIERTVTLPFAQVCLEHRLELQWQCTCKTFFKLFPRGKPPFCCVKCGLAWKDLPHKEASKADRENEEDLQNFFSVLFSQGTPKRLARLLSLIEECELRKEEQMNKRQKPYHYISRLIKRGTLSLEDVLEAIILLRLSFNELFADWTNTQDKISMID